MRPNKEYLQTEIDGKLIFVKKDCVNKLKHSDAVIFDCDGVLIDVRNSCNKAITRAVTYIIEELIGNKFSEELISKETIYMFKKSGGFNNDWDLAYALLVCIIFNLPQNFQERFSQHVNTNSSENNFGRLLSFKKKFAKKYNFNGIIGTLKDALKQYAKIVDDSGIRRIEKELSTLSNFDVLDTAIRQFLSYPGKVGESLLTTIFEEMFCGPDLFKKIYKQESRIYKKRGLINYEHVIIYPETLNKLTSILGKANFGIASGRPYQLAKYTLNGILERFISKALVFLEDVEAAESKAGRNNGLGISLKKPNPFSLIKSSEGLMPFKFALYIGDSIEDLVMVRKISKKNPRFVFIGVYNNSDFKNEILNNFLKMNAEVILPSVNNLPNILEMIKEGKL